MSTLIIIIIIICIIASFIGMIIAIRKQSEKIINQNIEINGLNEKIKTQENNMKVLVEHDDKIEDIINDNSEIKEVLNNEKNKKKRAKIFMDFLNNKQL